MKNAKLIDKIMSRFFMNVYADGDTGFTQEQVDEMLKKARQEEKDKLYGEIEALKEKNKKLSTEVTEKISKISNLESSVTDLETKVEEITGKLEDAKTTAKSSKDKEVQKLTDTIKDLTTKIDNIEKDGEERVRKLNLEIFKKEEILKAGDEIIVELVTGNTEEEITASIEKAKEAYIKIKEKTLSGVRVNGFNPNINSTAIKGKTAEEIASMSREEYAKWRKDNPHSFKG